MDTTLQNAHLTENELSQSLAQQELEEEEHHIHLPNPSFWPLILSAGILVTVAGMLFLPDNPWLSIVGAPFVLLGIMGWALEDPMAPAHGEENSTKTYIYRSTLTANDVLDMAKEVVDHNVTISSTAYSTHPVKVEIDEEKSDGVILALYGKVELEAQRELLEANLRELPNVLDVHNYIVAEDAILNIANARLENLRSKGKLEDAKNLSILVENYILHLYGDVPMKDMKQALEREMIGVPGVRVVVNHIGLNKDIPGNLGKTRNKI